MMKSRIIIFTSTIVSYLMFSSPAYAYLDSGTGSMLLQLALGGVAGLMVLGKLFWGKFVGLFRRQNGVAQDWEKDNKE